MRTKPRTPRERNRQRPAKRQTAPKAGKQVSIVVSISDDGSRADLSFAGTMSRTGAVLCAAKLIEQAWKLESKSAKVDTTDIEPAPPVAAAVQRPAPPFHRKRPADGKYKGVFLTIKEAATMFHIGVDALRARCRRALAKSKGERAYLGGGVSTFKLGPTFRLFITPEAAGTS